MSAATLPPPQSTMTVPPPRIAAPQPVKWTCDEFYELNGMPVLEGRKTILIDGEILEMPAPSHRASLSHKLCEDWCNKVFPNDHYWVRVQLGMILGINTDPTPDIAVALGAPRTHVQHPRTAELVIEVADTSFAYDTGDKASLYAAAGIRDYWVIDVENRQLHVFRDPQPDPTRRYNHWYASVTVLNPADTVAPLAAPNSPVTVGELMA